MNFPYHPFLVHFPIAFLLGAFLLQGVHLYKSNWICRVVGMWLLGFAAFFSIFAAITGQWELTKAGAIGYDMKVLEIINLHETMGNIVTWGSTLVFFVWVNVFFKNMQDKRIDKLAFAFLFILTCCVFFTAYLGGQLVWVYGVGIP